MTCNWDVFENRLLPGHTFFLSKFVSSPFHLKDDVIEIKMNNEYSWFFCNSYLDTVIKIELVSQLSCKRIPTDKTDM